jgi:hypothetical protein
MTYGLTSFVSMDFIGFIMLVYWLAGKRLSKPRSLRSLAAEPLIGFE